MGNTSSRRRFDFVQEVTGFDEETGVFQVILKPDPRRYKWKTVKGKRYLYDMLDNARFSEPVLRQLAEAMNDQPIYYQQQKIGDAGIYIQSRIPQVRNALEGKFPRPTFEDKSEEFLQSLGTDKLEFVIMSVDIVGSTKLSTTLPPELYSRVIATVLFELSEVVPQFHGHVLKYTGDGIIAYFPAPSFISKNDLAIDCALTIRGLVRKAIDPVLKERGIDPIDIRIGLDSGEAMIATIGSSEAKQHKDIIGAIVNLACKIQARAGIGGIALGDVTCRNLHIAWRQMCEPLDVGADWQYTDENGDSYKVHQIKFSD